MSRRPRDICAEVNPDKTEACTKHRHHRSPHSWQMDRAAALAEATRRWGKRAMVTEPNERGIAPGFCLWSGRVGLSGNLSHDLKGSGDSWEAAFADADRRAQR